MDSTYGTAYWQQLSFLPQPAPMTMAAANTVVMLTPQFAGSMGGHAAPQLITLGAPGSAPHPNGVVPPEMHAALSAAAVTTGTVSAPVSTAVLASADCETLIAEAHTDYRQGNYARALQYCQAVCCSGLVE